MSVLLRTAPLFAALALALPAPAADPMASPAAPKTLMLTPGKSLLSDDLGGPLAKDWKVGKGKWDAADGAVRGAELASDMHGAVARRNVTFKDAVIEYSFKLDGAKVTSLSLNGAKGHVCRVLVRANGFSVQKDDQDGKTGPDTGAVLDTNEGAVETGKWHTLVVELRGPDLLATLDGQRTAYGSHPAIDTEKTNLGLTVAGETASFKKLRVWESGGVAPGWEATKVKLQDRKKR